MTETRTETDARPDRGSRHRLLGRADPAIDREFPLRPAGTDADRHRPRAGDREAGGGAGEPRARPRPPRSPTRSKRPRPKSSRASSTTSSRSSSGRRARGTQSNMNVNEVIAGRANELLTGTRGGKSPVHPNDHVNMSQSSNDSFPTALHIAAALAVDARLLPALDRLHARARRQGEGVGRHRQDRPHPSAGRDAAHARPGIFGLCRTSSIAAASGSSRRVTHGMCRLAQGGTAVGTGLNAPAGLRRRDRRGDRDDHRPALRHRRRTSSRRWRRTTRSSISRARSTRWRSR